ncbi:hypothetical protein JW921_05215, partial [Candidatus Fermentibacterales bacterium]|nr:hypothetical protein [Candidatus Fermentibacterales bacterium]
MALDRVCKIEVLCHSVRRDALMDRLERTGFVQLIDLSERELPSEAFRVTSGETAALEEELGEVERVIRFLSEYEPTAASGPAPLVSRDQLERLAVSEELREAVRDAWQLSLELAEYEGDIKEAEHEAAFLRDWVGLGIPLEKLGRHRSFDLIAGTIE